MKDLFLIKCLGDKHPLHFLDLYLEGKSLAG